MGGQTGHESFSVGQRQLMPFRTLLFLTRSNFPIIGIQPDNRASWSFHQLSKAYKSTKMIDWT